MPSDPLLSRELKSLREELATTQRQRPVPPAGGSTGSSAGAGTGAGAAAVGESPAPSGRREEPADDQEMRGQLRDLVKEITDFVNDAEKNVSAHPAMSIVAAMLMGMVIGSLLARR
jgi:hypothetical protein